MEITFDPPDRWSAKSASATFTSADGSPLTKKIFEYLDAVSQEWPPEDRPKCYIDRSDQWLSLGDLVGFLSVEENTKAGWSIRIALDLAKEKHRRMVEYLEADAALRRFYHPPKKQ